MKLKFANIFRHFWLVTRHRYVVFINCAKCGLVWRGLVHDLSKFTPVEFFEGARYFQGNRSPIGVCRRERGVSPAWLHHKGRNKHHIEYWHDVECKIHPVMPYTYAIECVCDKLAATKIYNGKNYTKEKPIEHWLNYGYRVMGNPLTMEFIRVVFEDIRDHGENFVLNKKYMKQTYKRICENGSNGNNQQTAQS